MQYGIKPVGGTNGMNAAIIVEPLNNNVYLAVGPKGGGKAAYVYVMSTLLANQQILTTGTKKITGNVLVKFLKLYPNQYGLVTAIQGKSSTMKVWKYDPTTDRFVRDTIYSLKKLKLSRTTITLR